MRSFQGKSRSDMKPEIKTDTWMPLFVSDYLADTSHLSTEEHGAYLLLLMHGWMNGGQLPIDDSRLRRICRMDEKPWKASKEVIKEFFYVQDGALRHRRVDRELQRAQQNVNQRSAAGKASAEKRKAEREAQRNGNDHSTTVATEAEREAQRNGNDHSTTVATEAEREAQRNGKPPPPPPPVNLKPSSEQTTSTTSTGVAREQPHGVVVDAIHSRAVELAVLLRQRGAALQPSDPRVRGWAETGVTDAQALTALETAQQQRNDKANPQPINAGYLDSIIRGGSRSPPAVKGSSRQSRIDSYAAQAAVARGENEHEINRPGGSERVIDGEVVRVA